jgi:hypothetical protein
VVGHMSEALRGRPRTADRGWCRDRAPEGASGSGEGGLRKTANTERAAAMQRNRSVDRTVVRKEGGPEGLGTDGRVGYYPRKRNPSWVQMQDKS